MKCKKKVKIHADSSTANSLKSILELFFLFIHISSKKEIKFIFKLSLFVVKKKNLKTRATSNSMSTIVFFIQKILFKKQKLTIMLNKALALFF